MIYLGADHGGFDVKEKIKTWLVAHGYAYHDLGNTLYDTDDDYPLYAFFVAEAVAKDDGEKMMHTEGIEAQKGNNAWSDQKKGILSCRSSAGVVIAANKVPGIRAVSVTNGDMTRLARQHDDANVIAISGDWIDEHQITDILDTFLKTEFTFEERHVRRLGQIAAYEKKLMVTIP